MLEPDYCKARLLEIEVGRSFWQSTASPKNALNFYVRVVKPLRQLQRRGVVENFRRLLRLDWLSHDCARATGLIFSIQLLVFYL